MLARKAEFFIVIRSILHGVITKILARDKKGRRVSSPFRRGGVIFLERGAVDSHQEGGMPPF